MTFAGTPDLTGVRADITALEADNVVNSQTDIEQALKIIKLEVEASVTPESYTYTFAEIFEDADGYLNLIDTGNSTAPYDSVNKEYVMTRIDESGDNSSNSPMAAKLYMAKVVLITGNLTTVEVNIQAQANEAIKVGLYDSSGNLVAGAKEQTISTTGWVSIALTELPLAVTAGDYWVCVHTQANTSVYFKDDAGVGKDVAHAYGNAFPDPWGSPAGGQYVINFRCTVVSAGTGIVQTNNLTSSLSTDISKVVVGVYGTSISGITVDVSVDNGANYDKTNQALGTKIEGFTNTGNDLKLIFNLSDSEAIKAIGGSVGV